jgi:carotenoid cleavage oxygenase
VRHPSMFRTKHLGPNEGAPTLERWHLDGHGGAVKEERLDDRGQEFPRVDERRVGLPHRYGYAVAVSESDNIIGTETRLLRHDFERGTSEARPFGGGASVGEAVFVPRGAGAGESEGWLLLLVHDAETNASALHILNADDMAGEAEAIIDLPQRVPAGFHGNWVADPG